MTEKDLAERDSQDIAAVFSTREGRRFVARLLQYCGIYRSNWDANQHYMAFREGERAVGLAVLSWVQKADETAMSKLFEADMEREVTEWTKQD